MRFIGIVKRHALSIGRYTIDDAFISCADEQPSLLIKNQGPDIFRLRIEEFPRRTIFDLVDLAVWRRAGVKDILAIDGQRQNIEFGEIRYQRALA